MSELVNARSLTFVESAVSDVAGVNELPPVYLADPTVNLKLLIYPLKCGAPAVG